MKLLNLFLIFLTVQSVAQTPELIFRSGFEPDVMDITDGVVSDIIGIDNSVSPPNDWVNDLEAHPNIGGFIIQYQGGDDTMRFAKIVQDPTDPSNNVLQYWLKHPNVNGTKGRVQANLYGNPDLFEVYQKVRLYLPADWNIIKEANGTVEWLTIMEFWNNLPLQDPVHPFRITLGIHKKEALSQKLTFSLEAQTMPDPPPWPIVWEESAAFFSVPVEQWMTLEFYFKEGDAANGRFVMSVTPEGGAKQTIFDVTNFTHHPKDSSPDGLVRYNPMKLYTSDAVIDYVRTNGGVLQVYWDDFEISKGTSPVLNLSENGNLGDSKLFPNPTKEGHVLRLYNVQGRIVRTVSNIKSNHIIIEKENLVSGVYLFQLSTSKGLTTSGKLLIE